MKIKKSYIALILLVVYLLSTFAYFMVYSFRNPKEVQNVITYEIAPSAVTNLINNGATIMTFEYSSKCDTCLDQKAFLEGMAKEYKNQMILEEISNETYASPTLTIMSKEGNKTIADPTEDATFAALCDLLTVPPAECVAR